MFSVGKITEVTFLVELHQMVFARICWYFFLFPYPLKEWGQQVSGSAIKASARMSSDPAASHSSSNLVNALLRSPRELASRS